jgi:hypothetical protein
LSPRIATRLAALVVAALLAPSAVFAQAANVGVPVAPTTRAISGLVPVDLAGTSIAVYPWFDFQRSFFEGMVIEAGVDTLAHPEVVGRTAAIFLVAHRSESGWAQNPVLVDVRGASQPVTFVSGGIQGNRFFLDFGSFSGFAGTDLGVPFDLVIDFDGDGRLSPGDWIDGSGDEAGMYVLAPTEAPGPLAVTEVIYSGGSFLGQDLYYPTNIATLGALPVVIVSHGNGHDYTWYDHIGYHLASYGYIVMSHQNNTMPGVETASTTTLTNTEYLLSHLPTIAGGALVNHVDKHRMTWIGHSRGGEGVVRAYDRIIDGTYVPVNFTASDVVLISSIAPTDFLGTNSANPHAVNYSLWTGGADADVSGCADCEQCQTFHLHERATGNRHSITIYGAGHGAFHDGGGSTVATGPCLLSRTDVHAVMKSYLLPLVKYYIEGNVPAYDCLWRQFEVFRSTTLPVTSCMVVDLQYRPAPGAGEIVIDDFQTQNSTAISSSGGAVTFDVANLTEGRFDDPNVDFTNNAADPMNGMTLATATDTSRGIVFDWTNADKFLSFAVPPALADASAFQYLSFRACQVARHPNTTAVLGDLKFNVRLTDQNGVKSTISIGAYGGGIEEPYQRTACGSGAGWGNDFETIRMRLSDFQRDGSVLDLAHLASIDFLFGPSYGAALGRIGFDDLMICRR